MEKQKAKLIGKVVQLPANSNLEKVMENIKIPRNKAWYVLVEKQDKELHMVKYNKAGVNANQFVAELKHFYIQSTSDAKLKELFENIKVVGNENFSVIRNIPNVNVNGKKLMTKIMEDLIRLLRN